MAKLSKRTKARGKGISPAGGQAPAPWFSRDWPWAVLLVVATILAYLPMWWAGFIWDDEYHLTDNPCMVSPTGLADIWVSGAGLFFPLTLTTFWFFHAVWGFAPLPYHLLNVALQAASGIVLWHILRRLQVPGAWLGAALWTLHPLQVESVAWVSELKNTQSCFFYLLTILFFLRWLATKDDRVPGNRNYALTLLCTALALASKSTTVILPAELVLGVLWMEGSLGKRHLMALAPVFLLALIATANTLWPHPSAAGPVVDIAESPLTWTQKVALSGDVIWFYLGKLLWPQPLMAIYPRWQIDATHPVSFLPLALAIGVLGILAWKRESWGRPWLFALVSYLVALSPFLGLLDQSFWRYSFVEDHLQYLAGMGPLALAGAGLAGLSNRLPEKKPALRFTLGAVIVLLLGLLSWQRAGVFVSTSTLWTDAVAKNPNCWTGYNALGVVLADEGKQDEAIADYKKALAINPKDPVTHYNFGCALAKKGQKDDAMVEYQKALENNPDYLDAINNLGSAYLDKGQSDAAIVQFQKSLAIDPEHAMVLNNLGLALAQKGDMDAAIVQFQNAFKVDPNYAEAHNDLGVALSRKGEIEAAIAQFQESLRIKPDSNDAQGYLTQLLALARQKPASP